MSLFSNLATSTDIQDEVDSVGGGGPVDSGLYLCNIAMAYMSESTGGAMGLNLTLQLESGREVRQTIYVTSGKAKGQLNYYTTKTGDKRYLPGFNLGNNLCLLTVGKELSEMDAEEKVINIYSYDAKKEVPTKVPVITELLNQPIYAGIQQQLVDKNAPDANGVYQPTGETRLVNEIDKFFRAKDKLTTAEIRAEHDEPAFYDAWDKKWTGQVRDRSTGASPAASSGTVASPAFGAAAAKPKTSLFAS